MAENQSTYWVFGYGSLMWRPGFPYVQVVPAKLFGFHRRLCVYSYHYRGQDQQPGLVLGLEKGGSCRGMAFEVEQDQWPQTLAYLRERELVTNVYHEAIKDIHILDHDQIQPAVTYIVDRRHSQYTGRLTAEEIVALVRQGHGVSGSCYDYVMSTLAHLRRGQIKDRHLEMIAAALDQT